MKNSDKFKEPIKVLIPLNGRVLFIKDEDKKVSNGGILLTDNSKIEVLTGRVIEISQDVKDNPAYVHLKKLDKVVVNYIGAVPVELVPENKKFFLPVTSIIGVWKDEDDLPEDEE